MHVSLLCKMRGYSSCPYITVSSTIAIGCVFALGFLYMTRNRKKKWVKVGSIEQLSLYPIKGIPGIDLLCEDDQPEVIVTDVGIQCGALRDRSFILGFINDKQEFEFITMRVKPKLALITVTANSGFTSITLSAPGMTDLQIQPPLDIESLKNVSVEVWRSRGEGCVFSEDANDWFNKFLERDGCILLYADKPSSGGGNRGTLAVRHPNTDPKYGNYAPKNMQLLFADSSHLMLGCDISHDDVNKRLQDLGEPSVEVRCWKSNVWVNSLRGPFDEDSWAEVHFEGGASLKRLRPCNRCMVTTVDYVTGTHRKSREPLTTLRKYRQNPAFEGPLFGALLYVTKPGPVKLGMSVFAVHKPFQSLSN